METRPVLDVTPDPAKIPPRHILILTDRDWTHPQGGGTGTNLYGQVGEWLHWGHRVTVIAGDYPGAEPVQHPLRGWSCTTWVRA